MKKITYILFPLMFTSIIWCQTLNIITGTNITTLATKTILFMGDNAFEKKAKNSRTVLEISQNLTDKNTEMLDDSKPLHTNNVSKIVNANISMVNLHRTTRESFIINGLNSFKNVELKIYNIIGKNVFNKKFTSQSTKTISLPKNLFSGVYLVKIITKKAEYNKKLIIP